MAPVLLALLVFVACVAPGTISVGGSDSATPSDSGKSVDDSLPGDTSEDTGGDSGGTEPDPSRIFTLDTLHSVALTLSDDAWRDLSLDPYSPVVADLEFDGAAFPSVGVRVKGRLGSYRDFRTQKAALKIDFLEFGQSTKLEGLERLNLNNMVQDCAGFSELAAYEVNELVAGVPAPHVGYARVSLNGADMGVYSVVEDYDDRFLKRAFGSAAGNLYDGDYYLWGNGSYTLVDFTAAGQDYFGLDEGEDVELAQVRAITEAVAASMGRPGFAETTGALVDLDSFARFWAAAAWTGHADSYSYYSNNYRVFIPEGGKAVLMPWDPDWAFYAATSVTSPYGVLAQACKADTACHQVFLDQVASMSASAAAAGIPEHLAAAVALINPEFATDPRMERDVGSIRGCQAAILDWFPTRSDALGRVSGL